jgi:serine/threonine-protein kinase
MASDESSLIGRVIASRYRLEAKRGSGAMSTMYVATDLQLSRPVAVKLLDGEGSDPLAGDEQLIAVFRASQQAAAGLDHPNLASVEDWGEETIEGRRTLYTVQELLSGGSLREMLDRGRLLTPSQMLVVGLDLCRGLDYAHRRGVVHGEVHPGSVVFGDDRRARLTDLGVSWVMAERAWADPDGVDLERARYAAPEMARDGRPTEKADVYALCLTLLESVTGQLPFTADSAVAALANRADRLMPVSADLGPLAAVLERAGRPDPAERSSAAELGRALVQAAEKLPRPAPIPIVGGGLFADVSGPISRPVAPTEAGAPLQLRDVAPPAAVAVAAASAPPPASPAPPAAPSATTEAVPPPRPAPPGPPALYDDAALDTDEAPLRRRRGRRALAWIAGAVVLAAAGVLGYFVYQALSTQSHEVPAEIVGMPQAEALNLIAGFDWEVVERFDRSDEPGIEVGDVIRTDPAPGTRLDEGATLLMYVSEGPLLHPLPELAGQTLDDATIALESASLAIGSVGQRYDELVPEGAVIEWSVPGQPGLVAGQQVPTGTTVDVIVSQGPEPRTVPDLIGLTPNEVQAVAEQLGLVAVQYPDVFNDTIARGAVAVQSPVAGEVVERGAEVRYSLSKGPDVVVMPFLAGLDFTGVQQAILDAGLQVGTVTGNTAGPLSGAFANGGAVQGGQLLRRGTVIDLVYAP